MKKKLIYSTAISCIMIACMVFSLNSNSLNRFGKGFIIGNIEALASGEGDIMPRICTEADESWQNSGVCMDRVGGGKACIKACNGEELDCNGDKEDTNELN